MFVIHRRGCRPIESSAEVITVKRIGDNVQRPALTYVEFAHEGQPSSAIASTEITKVEEING